MKHLSLLIKPASSLCNMRCRYCFYADVAENREIPSYGVMPKETIERILSSVAADLSAGDELTLAFQGGEPSLAGIDFFRHCFAFAASLMPGVHLHYAFQTNGLLLNEEWCSLLKEYDVLVGVSVDGNAEMHNSCRPDAAGKGTYNRVRNTVRLLDKSGVRYNILTVLTSSMARHPSAVWNWIKKEHFDFVQFIPCLAPLDADQPSPFALSPERFRDFYLQLFPLWKKSLEEGRYISIKLFDDLVNLYLAGETTACGITGQCSIQYIVEANGDVFPCDFYVLDQFRMGSLLDSHPSELYSKGKPFLLYEREYCQEEPCTSCRYRDSCGGGCKRLKDSMYIHNGRCFYAELLDEILVQMLRSAKSYMSSVN